MNKGAFCGWRRSAAIRWGARDALVFGGARFTHADLDAWATSVADWLTAGGVGAGDRVLWQLPNCPEALVAHDAILSLGAVGVPVPMLYREHELSFIVADARPSAVICPVSFSDRTPTEELDRVLEAAGVTPLVRGSVGGTAPGWAPLPASTPPSGAPLQELSISVAEDDPVLILYTSGSTADPKGVVHTPASLTQAARVIAGWSELDEEDCCITGAPVAHIAGLLAASILPLATGGKAALLPRWDAAGAARLASDEGATFSCGATVFLQELVEVYENGGDDFPHRLATFICGGATIPPRLIPRADAQGIYAYRSWGMTEAPMVGMARLGESMELRSQSDGRVCPGAIVETVDEDRRPLPEGEVGELRLRAGQQMARYTDPEVTAAQVDGAGWFYTGDVGHVRQGVITMTGRIKDIINRGGEKFSAQDIEGAIAEHPDVAVAAVFSVPDARLGEGVGAAVELRSGASWPGPEALAAFLTERGLARQKIPQAWHVVDQLPRTPSGKIRKEELRKALAIDG